MGTVRSMMSLSCSNGILSSSLRSMSSMSFAFISSCLRLAVTFGWGMLLSVCASMISAQMLRTCTVLVFRSPCTMGRISFVPAYNASRSSMRLVSPS